MAAAPAVTLTPAGVQGAVVGGRGHFCWLLAAQPVMASWVPLVVEPFGSVTHRPTAAPSTLVIHGALPGSWANSWSMPAPQVARDALPPGQRAFAAVVKLVRTMLCTWGRGRP